MEQNFFRVHRDELELTQRQIADALGLTTQAISAWESNVALPELAIVDQVAEVYKVSPQRLLKEMKALAEAKKAARQKKARCA